MFAKVIIFFAAVSATQAGGLLGVGLGPIAATGHWEGPAVLTKSVIAAPVAVAQKTVFNSVAPFGLGAAQIGIGGLVHGGNGILSNGLLSTPIAGKYLINSPATVSSQRTVINHVAPVTKSVAVAAAPIYTNGLLGNGLISGNGVLNGGIISGSSIAGNGLLNGGIISGSSIAGNGLLNGGIISGSSIYGNGLLSGRSIVGNGFLGLGNGILGAPVFGKAGIATPATAYSQSSVIDHVAPVSAPVQIASAPVGIVTNDAWGTTTGLIGGGLAGNVAFSGPAAVSSQSTIISNVAPFGVSAAPINKGLVSNGLVSSVANNGLWNGGYIGAPVVGKAIVATPNTVSSQSTLINHVAPANVAVAAPVTYSSGIINNGLYGGAIGHGIGAAPISISSGLLGTAWGGMYGLGAGNLGIDSGLAKSHW